MIHYRQLPTKIKNPDLARKLRRHRIVVIILIRDINTIKIKHVLNNIHTF